MIDKIEENFNFVQILLSNGKIDISVMNEYHIYKEYEKLKNIKSKMERYTIVSENLKVSEMTVRRAVYSMEKEICN